MYKDGIEQFGGAAAMVPKGQIITAGMNVYKIVEFLKKIKDIKNKKLC